MILPLQKKNSRKTGKPSLAISALSNWLPLVTNVLTALLLTPFLLEHLGKRNYGVWSLTLSFVGYYGLMQLSVGSGIMRFVPFYEGREDTKAASEIVSTGLALFAVVGLMILMVSALLAEPLARFYQGGGELATLIRLTGIAAAIECPTKIFGATLKARGNWVTANIIAGANGILYATCLAISLLAGGGLAGMGLALIISDSITLSASFVALHRNCPEIRLGVSMVRWSRLRELLGFGILCVIGSAAYNMELQNHKVIIGKLVSLEAVAVYAIATQLIERVRGIVSSPLQVSWPRFALLTGQNRHQEVVELFHKTTRYSGILASGAISILFLAGPPFIELWLGTGFEAANAVLFVLGVGCLVESTLFGNSSYLGGTGRQGMQSFFACIEGAGGLSLSILLGWKMGLVGVALGYTVFVVLIRGLVCTWYICRLLSIGQMAFYARTLMRPWLMLGAIALIGSMVKATTHATGWPSWLVLVFLVTSLYSFLTWVFVLDRQEKKFIFDTVRFLPIRVQTFLARREKPV